MSKKGFKPAWWLRNSHLQTIWPSLCRGEIKNLVLERERLELPDGDFVDLDWLAKPKTGPIVLILHGFEGSINSPYAKGMLRAIELGGWRGVFMHFRGCSGEPNRLPRGYHSGDTADLAYVVNLLMAREKCDRFAAIGYSLGGNVLLKWLGETGKQNPLAAAVAVSVPFDLKRASTRIQRGVSRIYQWYLLRFVLKRLRDKFLSLTDTQVKPESFAKIQTIYELDEKYTVPYHGFASVEEFYALSSSRQYLRFIEVPTLLLHAKDDPFMTEDVIPTAEELSAHIQLELSESGGHVGFVSGRVPWRAEYWLEQRVPIFLENYLK